MKPQIYRLNTMGAKKKTSSPEEDEALKMSMEQFWKVYKMNCKNLEIPISKLIKDKYEEAQDDDTVMQKFHIWEQLGW